MAHAGYKDDVRFGLRHVAERLAEPSSAALASEGQLIRTLMAQPAAAGEEEHSRLISSTAIEWTTKPVTGFLKVCNEPILCSEVRRLVVKVELAAALMRNTELLLCQQEDEDVQLERRGDLLAPLKVCIIVVTRSGTCSYASYQPECLFR